MGTRGNLFFLLVVLLTSAGCANITAPTGGKKDIRPPRRLSLAPADSLLNTRVKRIDMYFDEYLTAGDISKEVTMSPILPIQPVATAMNKHVTMKIVDSLLEDNTTYRINFGNGIKDLHEGNPRAGTSFTFSTGPYFDSLQLHGTVVSAATGLSDQEGIVVALYYAADNDSAVVRHKPKYIARTDATGGFIFDGLPARTFRIYALKDANDNLVYDGPIAGEQVGFADNNVIPGDTSQASISLMVFAEIPDTSTKKSMDSVVGKKEKMGMGSRKTVAAEGVVYSVNIDTSNAEKRSFDITGPAKITFNRLTVLNREKITLTYDSLGMTITPKTMLSIDSIGMAVQISTAWRPDMVYTLRLVKGFAKDTSGSDLMPSRYVFRTKSDDDYGIIKVNLPSKYNNGMYLFRAMADGDSVYQQPVTNMQVVLTRLKPAKYTFRVVADKNRNGKWDTGDLLGKVQPEEVIPYRESITLKPGFEHVIDFEQKPATKPSMKQDK